MLTPRGADAQGLPRRTATALLALCSSAALQGPLYLSWNNLSDQDYTYLRQNASEPGLKGRK